MKKLLSILLALTLVLALGVTAFAQDVTKNPVDADNATITIDNAANGVEYKVYQIFDATVTGTKDGSIAYQLMSGKTDVPGTTSVVFTKDSNGYVSSNAGGSLTGLKLTSADIQTLIEYSGTPVATATSDGSTLNFKGLAYGYYLVTTNQGDTLVTVTSTNPSATVYDKNSTTPVKDLTKTANDESYNIGDTIEYTVSFATANYSGAGEDAKQIVSYTIKDTLPSFLKDGSVTVTSITIGGSAYTVDGATPQFDNNGEITIPWVDNNNKSIYANGATIVITYTAVLDSDAAIDGNGNINTVTITFKDEDGNSNTDTYETTETVYTYALAIKKVDQSGNALDGAYFSLNGYQTSGEDGVYTVTGKTATGGTDTVMDTDSNGILIIKGVKAGDYSLTETTAPNGYNKLTTTVDVTAKKTGESTTTYITHIDENGNETTDTDAKEVTYTNSELSAATVLVVNKTGSQLPSTGGIGTTIFTVVGIVLMAGAAILLITKKRMEGKETD